MYCCGEFQNHKFRVDVCAVGFVGGIGQCTTPEEYACKCLAASVRKCKGDAKGAKFIQSSECFRLSVTSARATAGRCLVVMSLSAVVEFELLYVDDHACPQA